MHVDIDECQNGEASCHSFAQCVNTQGNYQCVCINGYELAVDQHSCIGKCTFFVCTSF